MPRSPGRWLGGDGCDGAVDAARDALGLDDQTAPGILENRKAKDSSKNEKHGDGGRALDALDKQIEAYDAQLKNAKTRREKKKIQKKKETVRRLSEKKKKGETHSRRPKRNR